MNESMVSTGRGSPSKRSSSGVQSIHRAVELLRAISRNGGHGMRLTSLSRELGLNITTAHRLLSTLVGEGLASYDNLTKKYFVGLELANLGLGTYKLALIDSCRQALENICRQTEDSVFLFMKMGSAGLCLKRVEGRYPVRALSTNEGDYRPLGIGAGSLAILAYLPDKLIKRILAGNGKGYSEFSFTAENVSSWVKATRKRGYAWNDQGISQDVCAVGLPLSSMAGETAAAVSVAAIQTRMTMARREEIVGLIREEIEGVVPPNCD